MRLEEGRAKYLGLLCQRRTLAAKWSSGSPTSASGCVRGGGGRFSPGASSSSAVPATSNCISCVKRRMYKSSPVRHLIAPVTGPGGPCRRTYVDLRVCVQRLPFTVSEGRRGAERRRCVPRGCVGAGPFRRARPRQLARAAQGRPPRARSRGLPPPSDGSEPSDRPRRTETRRRSARGLQTAAIVAGAGAHRRPGLGFRSSQLSAPVLMPSLASGGCTCLATKRAPL